MNKKKLIFISINFIIIILFLNYSVLKKEKILSNGKIILLKLIPKDPRSLMQGDYMALNYQITNSIEQDKISKKGYIIVKLDSNNIASKIRVQEEPMPLNKEEYLIKYNIKYNSVVIASNSFFFQEGKSKSYSKAKYGALKVSENGTALLYALYDENIKKIE